METKYTPGPWSLNGYEYDMGRHVYSLQGSNHTVTMPDGSKQQPTIGMIRFCGVYKHNVVLDENGQSDMTNQSEVAHLANAKLIAAAPSMYKFIESLLHTLQNVPEFFDPQEWIDAATNELSKATP